MRAWKGLLGSLTVCLALMMSITLVACTTKPEPVLTKEAVEKVAQDAIAAYPGPVDADSEALKSFCADFSDVQRFCINQGARASAEFGEVDTETVEFFVESVSPTTYKVTFTGKFLSGVPFTSETESSIYGDRIVLSIASFWVERRYGDSTDTPSPSS